MNVTELPFNRLIGLQAAGISAVTLPAGEQYTNHLGTVHGSALLAVAEAGSGAFIIEHFSQRPGLIPVVRNLTAKFRKPASGAVTSRTAVPAEAVAGWLAALDKRGRVLAEVPVEVVDASGDVVLRATVEWFLAESPT
ncbi:MAG: DUF4442 domain-containing protein [Pseudomonadota bacterium]